MRNLIDILCTVPATNDTVHFYLLGYGDVTYSGYDKITKNKIQVYKNGLGTIDLNEYGQFRHTDSNNNVKYIDGLEMVLFPSKEDCDESSWDNYDVFDSMMEGACYKYRGNQELIKIDDDRLIDINDLTVYNYDSVKSDLELYSSEPDGIWENKLLINLDRTKSNNGKLMRDLLEMIMEGCPSESASVEYQHDRIHVIVKHGGGYEHAIELDLY